MGGNVLVRIKAVRNIYVKLIVKLSELSLTWDDVLRISIMIASFQTTVGISRVGHPDFYPGWAVAPPPRAGATERTHLICCTFSAGEHVEAERSHDELHDPRHHDARL